MRLGIRARILLVGILLTAAALFSADAYLSSTLDRYLTSRIRDDLRQRLELAELPVSRARLSLDGRDSPHGSSHSSSHSSDGSHDSPNSQYSHDSPISSGSRAADNSEDWDGLADELGRRARARITIIRLDGRVLGDSEMAMPELGSMENHARRPEIVQALDTGYGASIRLSTTIGHRMMYSAVPFLRDGETAGVVRAAVPLSEVDAAIAHARRLLLIASLLALGVSTVLATVAAQRIARAVRDLIDAARRMASGALDVRTHASGQDELGELGRALDHLARSLASSLAEL
ncbi:MAG: HAMP domain-containing protein [Pseudomonadota bacterium]